MSLVRANSEDYSDIIHLYQQLIYWKKIAVKIGIPLKPF